MPEKHTGARSHVRPEFFDGKRTLPSTVAGIPTSHLLRLTYTAQHLLDSFNGGRGPLLGAQVTGALEMLPFVEHALQSETLGALDEPRPSSVSARREQRQAHRVAVEEFRSETDSEERRGLRRGAKAAVSPLWLADKFVLGLSIFGVGIPLRQGLNATVEKVAARKVREMKPTIEAKVAVAERLVDRIAAFPNPREAFRTDIDNLYRDVQAQARARLSAGDVPSLAQGVARVLRETISGLAKHDGVEARLPILQAMMQGYTELTNREVRLPSDTVLAIAAPELMRILETFLKQDHTFSTDVQNDIREHGSLLLSVGSSVAPLFAGRQLDALHDDGPVLLQSVSEILPEDGQQFAADFHAFTVQLLGKPTE